MTNPQITTSRLHNEAMKRWLRTIANMPPGERRDAQVEKFCEMLDGIQQDYEKLVCESMTRKE